jgi:UDP-3-O-[3-hydroxymyristoyl] glucosamine N-acyltransferase
MHNLNEDTWKAKKHSIEPWSVNSAQIPEQQIIQTLLTKRANATFGTNCYIAVDCNFFTDKATLGNSVKIASLATIRGNVQLGNDVSVNSMANLVGNITIGK